MMAETSSSAKSSASPTRSRTDPEGDPDLQVFGQVPELLAKRDDTSRFVGLTILRSIIDSREDVRNNQEALHKIWHVIPKKFLIRLLNSKSTTSTTPELAKDLKHLAVGVIHTFFCLLIPDLETLEDGEVTPINMPLVKALSSLEAPQRMLGLQIMQRVAESASHNTYFVAKGLPLEFWQLINTDESAFEEALAFFRIARFAWKINDDEPLDSRVENWNQCVEKLLQSNEARLSPVLGMLADVIASSILHEQEISKWLPLALFLLKKQFLSDPSANLIRTAISFSANLFNELPSSNEFLQQLFFSWPNDVNTNSSLKLSPSDMKVFANLFPNLLIAEIRSSIPSLISLLHEPSYPLTSLQLSRTFDLLGGFITMLLVDEYDSDAGDESDHSPSEIIHQFYDPNALLRLRSDVTEALSLSIEFLRDRFDASKGGTRGLHPDLRAPDAATAVEANIGPLQLTWDASSLPMTKDPLVQAILRVLGLWLSEDDSSNLVNLASGLVDVLLDLYQRDDNSTKDGILDCRNEAVSILITLFRAEAEDETMDDDDVGYQRSGTEIVEEFLELDGWKILSASLAATGPELLEKTKGLDEWQLVRGALLPVLQSDAIMTSRDAWMNIVHAAASRSRDFSYTSLSIPDESSRDSDIFNLHSEDGMMQHLRDEVAVYLLAVELVRRAPTRKRVLYLGDLKIVHSRLESILEVAQKEVLPEDLVEEVNEVIEGMEELGIK